MGVQFGWLRNRLWLGAILVVAALPVIFVYSRFNTEDLARHIVLRAGAQGSPPWFLLQNGTLDGPIFEIVTEAARRRGLQIRWVVDPSGPDHAFKNDVADLWPYMGRFASRTSVYDITEPWQELSYILTTSVSCSARQAPEGEPRTIAHRGTAVILEVLAGRFPHASPIHVESHARALRAVCTGEADAAIIPESALAGAFQDAPGECRERNICLKTSPVATVGFGIGARPGSREAKAAAKILRAEIDRMIDDGTLSGTLLRWGVSSGEIRALRSAGLAKDLARLMTGVAAALVLALLTLWVVYQRLLSAKRAGEQVQAELRTSRAALQAELERRKDIELRYYQSQRLESLGRLAGGIAHDFNNLLTVILGFAELALTRGEEIKPIEDLLEQIRGAANKAAGLTRQLLAFSRKQVLRRDVIDINEVVEETRSMLAPLLGARIRTEIRLDPAVGRVLADAGQMHQVLVNLAVNARDAMPDGGTLTIATSDAPPGQAAAKGTQAPARSVLLTISDTGTGISPEAMEHLFEPFFTTKEPGKGTGLGLSMVYGIVEQSGGQLAVQSSPGSGTTFTILLPVTDQEPASTPVEPQRFLTTSGSVLLVEDDPAVRRYTCEILTSRGYRVIEADCGETALRVAQDAQIAVLVTDVVMPGMTGPEVAAALRRSRPELRVIYVSAHVDAGSLQQLVDDSAAWFLSKPFDGRSLSAMLSEVLSSSTGPPA